MYIDEEQLLADLSNFYTDFTFDDSAISFIFNSYASLMQSIEAYILQVKDDMNISTINAYRTIPFKLAPTDGATYDYSNLLYDKYVASKLSLSGSLSDRINCWLGTSDDSKIDMLANTDHFIQLLPKRDSDTADAKVIDLDISEANGAKLTRGVDYLLDTNRIFLLGDYASVNANSPKLALSNIIVDYNVPELTLGKSVGVVYNDIITKPEYRDFMQMLAYASLGGPTINNIKAAFGTLSGWSNVEIVDMISATGINRTLWYTLAGDSALTPFDFLISIPVEYFTCSYDSNGNLQPDDEKITMFSSFLDIVKPSYTNYVIAWSQHIADVINNKDSVSMMRKSVKVDANGAVIFNPDKTTTNVPDIIDKLSNGTTRGVDSVTTKAIQSDSYVLALKQNDTVTGVDNCWDSGIAGMLWDTNLKYDVISQSIPSLSGDQSYSDWCDFNYITFPEFPINFTAIRDIVTGNVTTSFVDNASGITRYEVLRNGIIVGTIIGTGGGSTLTVMDNTLNSALSGVYTYSARSVYEVIPGLPQYNNYSVLSMNIKITR